MAFEPPRLQAVGADGDAVEAALAHAFRDQTEAAYARSDRFERRRHLMDDWTEYLAETRGQVLSLKR